jgi:hypothetical protein
MEPLRRTSVVADWIGHPKRQTPEHSVFSGVVRTLTHVVIPPTGRINALLADWRARSSAARNFEA